MNETISWFGWLPDADDERDHHFRADSALLRQLPPKVDESAVVSPEDEPLTDFEREI